MLEDVRGSELVDLFQNTEFDEEGAWMAGCPYPGTARKLAQFASSTLQVMKRRVGILVKSNPFLRGRGSSIPDVLKDLGENRVVLIDIPGMGETERALCPLGARTEDPGPSPGGGLGLGQGGNTRDARRSSSPSRRPRGSLAREAPLPPSSGSAPWREGNSAWASAW